MRSIDGDWRVVRGDLLSSLSLPLLVAVLTALTALSAVRPAVADEPAYSVGVAEVDITPELPIRLRGYAHRKVEAEAISERLFAQALAVGEGGGKGAAVLVTLDNTVIPDALARRVAARLESEAGVPREALALCATHTHNGPFLSFMPETIYVHPLPAEEAERIDRYTRVLEDRLVKVALEALGARRPASLAWGVGSVDFARNRRTEGGPVDHDLPVLVARSADGDPFAVWTSYACHCTTLSHNRVSGDWAGAARASVRAKVPGVVALVSAGAGGDQNPLREPRADFERQDEMASEHGAAVAREVTRVIETGARPVQGALVTQLAWLDLPLAELPARAEWERLAAGDHPAGTKGYHAKVQLERLERGEKLPTVVPYPVATWRFAGDLAIVFLGGEAVVDYSLRLKRELRADRLWVNAYANDVSCYIPSERVLAEGGYEGGGAMVFHGWPGPFAPGIEDRIVNEVKRQLPDFAGGEPAEGR